MTSFFPPVKKSQKRGVKQGRTAKLMLLDCCLEWESKGAERYEILLFPGPPQNRKWRDSPNKSIQGGRQTKYCCMTLDPPLSQTKYLHQTNGKIQIQVCNKSLNGKILEEFHKTYSLQRSSPYFNTRWLSLASSVSSNTWPSIGYNSMPNKPSSYTKYWRVGKSIK